MVVVATTMTEVMTMVVVEAKKVRCDGNSDDNGGDSGGSDGCGDGDNNDEVWWRLQ